MGMCSLGSASSPALEADLVADGLTNLLAALLRHALGDAHCADAPRLRAEDATRPAAVLAVVEDHLWNLNSEQHTSD